MARLSTHILDTSAGTPAVGVRVELRRIRSKPGGEPRYEPVARGETDSDGRHAFETGGSEGLPTGGYELTFHVGAYFASRGAVADAGQFLDTVPVRFMIAAGQRYHVPLLVSPYGYTSYRGS